MARTKWLALSFDKSLSDIATLLDRHKFSKDQIIGFELTNIQRNKVCGKFIEKIITTEVVIDPFGEEILNHVQRYSIFNFEISPKKSAGASILKIWYGSKKSRRDTSRSSMPVTRTRPTGSART